MLAPSLERHKGCHIIDIEPGVGLWSSKIHDLLRPKSHVLVEPNPDVYLPFLKPLLDAPGSKYKLMVADIFGRGKLGMPEQWTALQEMVDMPEPDDAQLCSPTDSVLILASMAQTPPRKQELHLSLSRSRAEPFIHGYLHGLLERRGLHLGGSARLLLWTLDSDKFNVLPRSVAGLAAPTAWLLNETCDVDEVVGSSGLPSARRPAEHDLHSALRVARRMKDDGVSIPTTRQNHVFRRANQALNDKDGSVSVDRNNAEMSGLGSKFESVGLKAQLKELEDLEYQWTFPDGKVSEPSIKTPKIDPTATQILSLRKQLDTYVGAASPVPSSRVVDRIVIMESTLNQMERDYAAGKFPREEMSVKMDEMDKLASKITEFYAFIPTQHTRLAKNLTDNLEASKGDPPLLAWDDRTTEPLDVKEGDFWPMNGKLALLDIKPRMVEMGGVSKHPLIRAIRSHGTSSIREALERVAFGAADALLPRVKSLNDPLRGGRLHLANLRCRMLTLEMTRELLAEWEKWPFKRSNEELLLSFGDSSIFEGKGQAS